MDNYNIQWISKYTTEYISYKIRLNTKGDGKELEQIVRKVFEEHCTRTTSGIYPFFLPPQIKLNEAHIDIEVMCNQEFNPIGYIKGVILKDIEKLRKVGRH